MGVFFLISQKLFWLIKFAQKSESTPKSDHLTAKLYEFLMKRIGSPKNGNICAFFRQMLRVASSTFRKRPPKCP